MGHHILSLLLAVMVVWGQQTVPDGPRGNIGTTKFESCGGGGLFGGGGRCFKVKLVKLSVQMGNQDGDGTDDDVRVKVCSDEAEKTNSSCCITPKLKRTFHDDWSRGDLEVWEQDKLGENCTKSLFTIRKGLEVTLLKTGNDNLVVNSIIIDTKAETEVKTKRVEQQFKCGQINLNNTNSAGTKLCVTYPYSYERIKLANVTMGNTGTDNAVRVDICSDVDKNFCCKVKLSSTIPLIDDWSRNDNEIWSDSYFGKCKEMMYRVNNTLRVGLETKNVAKNGLVVNKLLVKMENLQSESHTYDCKGYTMTGKARQENTCIRQTSTTTTTGNKKGVASLVSQVGSLAKKTATRPVFKG